MECFSCEERLNRLNLLVLEQRVLRGDLINIFKMMEGIDRVNSKKLFPIAMVSKTINHRCKLSKRFIRDLKKNYFTQMVVGIWKAVQEGG